MLSFHVKFVQTDRRTTVKQYAPDLSMRGHKNQDEYERSQFFNFFFFSEKFKIWK